MYPYGRGYTVDCLGNMVGGRSTFYNNQPIEMLAQLASKSIEANEMVWLGCDVSKRFAAKQGIEDLFMYVYNVYNFLSQVKFSLWLNFQDG